MELNDYIQGSKQLCVSVSLADAIYLKKSNFSPSRLLRKAIRDLQNNKQREDLQEMSMKIDNMARLIQQQAQFVSDQGLAEQFGHFQDKKNEEALQRNKHKDNVVESKEIEKEVNGVFKKQ